MSVARPRVSYTDLQHMPEDGHQYELHDGEMSVVPAPLPRHQRAVRELLKHLDRYGSAVGGEVLDSPIDVVFSEFDVLQPDVLFFATGRTHLIQPDRPIRSAPDLVVEVTSPGTATTDRTKKMQTYATYGVGEYWLVDLLARRVELYTLAAGRFTLQQTAEASDVVRSVRLSGLAIPAQTLFGD